MMKLPDQQREPEIRFSENNFDLVRLVAASEVAVRHSLQHVAPSSLSQPMLVALAVVPGVPIFFFLSGFLISRSVERSSGFRSYARNRMLRLFPALWTCVAVSVILLFATGYMRNSQWTLPGFVAWVFAQSTVLQYWNPAFLRGFGDGVVNGSLWSISVELQFYGLAWIIHLRLRRLSATRQILVLSLLCAGFMVLGGTKSVIVEWLDSRFPGGLAGKLYRFSFAPFFYMFLMGWISQRLWGRIVPLLVDKRVRVLVIYTVAMIVDYTAFGLPLGNELPVYLAPAMGAAVLSLAYSKPSLASRLLRGNDVSYGLYIYHMPIVNTAIYLGFNGSILGALACLAMSFGCACLSWKFVERPFLSRKRDGQRPAA